MQMIIAFTFPLLFPFLFSHWQLAYNFSYIFHILPSEAATLALTMADRTAFGFWLFPFGLAQWALFDVPKAVYPFLGLCH